MTETKASRKKNVPERRKKAFQEFDHAVTLLQEGKHEEAETEFLRIQKKYAAQLDIVNRANIYLSKYIHPEKKKKIRSNDPEELHQLGIDAYNHSDLDQAIKYLEKAVKLDESNAEIQYDLACLHAVGGSRRKVKQFLSQAFEIEPELKKKAEEDEDLLENLKKSDLKKLGIKLPIEEEKEASPKS